jgi:hypothetical protein
MVAEYPLAEVLEMELRRTEPDELAHLHEVVHGGYAASFQSLGLAEERCQQAIELAPSCVDSDLGSAHRLQRRRPSLTPGSVSGHHPFLTMPVHQAGRQD